MAADEDVAGATVEAELERFHELNQSSTFCETAAC